MVDTVQAKKDKVAERVRRGGVRKQPSPRPGTRAFALVRRYRLAPYLLLLPSVAEIGRASCRERV